MSGAADAGALLGLYQPGTALFMATPCHTLLAAGERARLRSEGGAGQWQALAGRAQALLAEQARQFGAARALLVGALPFDERLPARLVVPETIGWAGPQAPPAAAAAAALGAPQAIRGGELRSVPSGADYVTAVEQALRQIRDGELRKVVLARSLEMSVSAAPDVAALLRNLVLRNQGAYIFAVEVGEAGEAGKSRTLIGASPELLVTRRGRTVLANPLAGSAPRSADPEQDRAIGAALLTSRKDLREHAFVVEAVAASLKPYCVELSVPEQPVLMQTATMWHLSTQVRGQLADSATCALRLATALHPTPAICGTPTAPAQAAIRTLEGFERGYYAGLVGWSDASGDGDWIVTIRCAEVERERIRLYAGAGIVDGSDAQAELNETSAKFRTVLSAMGIEL